MRPVLYVIILLSFFTCTAFAAEKSKPIKRMDNLIAVFDFDVQGDIDKGIARSLAESVRIELVNSGKYEVIDRSNMNNILKEQAFQMTGCVAKECAVEAGQMLGVGKIVAGTVGLIGKTYYLTLSLVNVETGKTEVIKDEECKCEVDALISTSKRVAKAIMGQPVAPQPQVVTTVEKVLSAPTIIGDTYKDPVTGMEFAYVKGGCFLMGDAFGDGENDERPVHEVCLDDYYIGKTEVTEYHWKKIIGALPTSSPQNGDEYPIAKVGWDDVMPFLLKMKQQTGKNYRLPTEAEWEYAARSGGKDDKWAGTSDKDSLDDYAWYKLWYRGGIAAITNSIHPIGQKKPNALGLYDMSGNVKEWVNDVYSKVYYSASAHNNPKGAEMGSIERNEDHRVLRGGSFASYASKVKTSSRENADPSNRSNDNGFRVVLQIRN